MDQDIEFATLKINNEIIGALKNIKDDTIIGRTEIFKDALLKSLNDKMSNNIKEILSQNNRFDMDIYETKNGELVVEKTIKNISLNFESSKCSYETKSSHVLINVVFSYD